MARMRRNSEQTLEFKIEQAEAKVARTREAHEKCKLRLIGTPVPLLRNGYSIFIGTKYR